MNTACIPADIQIDLNPRNTSLPTPILPDPYFEPDLVFNSSLIISGCIAKLKLPTTLTPIHTTSQQTRRASSHVEWACSQNGNNPGQIDLGTKLVLSNYYNFSQPAASNVFALKLALDDKLLCLNTFTAPQAFVNNTCITRPTCPTNLNSTKNQISLNQENNTSVQYYLHGCIWDQDIKTNALSEQFCSYIHIPPSMDCLSANRASKYLSVSACSSFNSDQPIDFLTAVSLIQNQTHSEHDSTYNTTQNSPPITTSYSDLLTWGSIAFSSPFVIIASCSLFFIIMVIAILYRRHQSTSPKMPQIDLNNPILPTSRCTIPSTNSESTIMDQHSQPPVPNAAPAFSPPPPACPVSFIQPANTDIMDISGVSFMKIMPRLTSASVFVDPNTTIKQLIEMWDDIYCRFLYHCTEAVKLVNTDVKQFNETLHLLMGNTATQVWDGLQFNSAESMHANEVINEMASVLTLFSFLFPDIILMGIVRGAVLNRETMIPINYVHTANSVLLVKEMVFPGFFDMRQQVVVVPALVVI